MAKMTQFMRADGNTDICMRRKELGVSVCDPLSDNNVFSLLPSQSFASTAKKTNIFMLATRVMFCLINLNKINYLDGFI